MTKRHLFDFRTGKCACGADGSGFGERIFLEEHPVNRCGECWEIALQRISDGEYLSMNRPEIRRLAERLINPNGYVQLDGHELTEVRIKDSVTIARAWLELERVLAEITGLACQLRKEA